MVRSFIRQTTRRAIRPLARSLRQNLLPQIMPSVHHSFPSTVDNVRVVGLLSSSSGLGESARLCVKSLANAGYKITTANVSSLYSCDDRIDFPGAASRKRADLTIYHLNPNMLLPSIFWCGPMLHFQTYCVGYWAWELEVLPAEWIRAIDFVDAILVPSQFCKAAIQRHTNKPVVVVPHPVSTDYSFKPASVRAQPDKFRIVSIFNLGSSFERKNPSAGVAAFKLAFGDDNNVELVLKISDGARYPQERNAILNSIGDANNIRLIDETWDRSKLQNLLASADAYLSLHRSEGFGLTLAEAALQGVPLITTHWSGNVDFCRPDLCFPVDYRLVPFWDNHSAYFGVSEARWAEPNVEHAAFQLQKVRAYPSEARARAAVLRPWLEDYLAVNDYRHALSELSDGSLPCT